MNNKLYILSYNLCWGCMESSNKKQKKKTFAY